MCVFTHGQLHWPPFLSRIAKYLPSTSAQFVMLLSYMRFCRLEARM